MALALDATRLADEPPPNRTRADMRTEIPLSPAEVPILLQGLMNSRSCSSSLTRLARYRKQIPDLPQLIVQTPGVIDTLMKCIEEASASMQDPSVWTKDSTNRTSGALAMFQVLASHPDTRSKLPKQLPQRLLPFLSGKQQDARSSAVQTTALGVVAALLKADTTAAPLPLEMQAQVKAMCEEIAEEGQPHSQSVATYILRKLGHKTRHKSSTDEDQRKERSTHAPRLNNIPVKDIKHYEPRHHVVWGDFERVSDGSGSDSEGGGFLPRRSAHDQPIYRVEMSSGDDSQ
mmetsp:Transcript_41179/g.94718  ORF Transcript_41179/g.94718 Transcript_41179/m.94718 type:complete len:289 (-) Transcript_41179:226-1092(-)